MAKSIGGKEEKLHFFNSASVEDMNIPIYKESPVLRRMQPSLLCLKFVDVDAHEISINVFSNELSHLRIISYLMTENFSLQRLH